MVSGMMILIMLMLVGLVNSRRRRFVLKYFSWTVMFISGKVVAPFFFKSEKILSMSAFLVSSNINSSIWSLKSVS